MDNKELMRYFYETVVSENLLDKVEKYVSDACVVCVGADVFPLGVEGMKEHLIAVKKTYPDYKMHIIKQHCDGEYVISEFLMEGTHEGEWLGIKPTGKKLVFTGVDIDRVRDGKMVEHGGAVNTFETLLAAGLIRPVTKDAE